MRQCLVMARTWGTPATDWLGRPVAELADWIRASNEIINEEREARR